MTEDELKAIEARYLAYAADTLGNLDEEPGLAAMVPALVAEVRRLREALQLLADQSGPVHESTIEWGRCVAHRALAGQPLFDEGPPPMGTAICPGCSRPFQTGFPVQEWARCFACHAARPPEPLRVYPAMAKDGPGEDTRR